MQRMTYWLSVASILAASAVGVRAQTPAPAGGGQAASALQPAVDELRQTLQGLHLDKWKGNNARSDADQSIHSIMQDLENKLPELLKAADANPASVSASLPVLGNVNLLSNVLEHVYDIADGAAPHDQVDALSKAITDLDHARRSFADHLTETAGAQEKQMADLQAKVKAQSMMTCPAPPPPPVCPTPKKTVKKKPKPAASTTAPATKPAKPAAAATPNQ